MFKRTCFINKNKVFTACVIMFAAATIFVPLVSHNVAFAQTGTASTPAVVNEQTQVTLSGVGSFTPVAGNTLVKYYWQQMSGDAVSFVNGGQTITFTTPPVSAGDTKYLRFALTVTDNHGATSSTAFNLQVVHIDHPPTVVTQHELVVAELSQVTLTGTATDIDNNTLTYQWKQISGNSTVTLSKADQPFATFTAPSVGSQPSITLQFTLTAYDGHGGQGSDSETVIVMSNSNYNSPSIQCGPVIGGVRGSQVILPATVNNPSNIPLTYSWKQISGWPAKMSAADTLNPSITVPNGPDLSQLGFLLTVSSGQTVFGSCDSFVYTQSGYAFPPIANAGPDRTVNGTDQVTLDGSKSIGYGYLTYSWRQVSGVPVTLLYTNSATPQFVAPDVPVGSMDVLVFELSVSNGYGKGADQVQITVVHPNVPPTAVITMQ